MMKRQQGINSFLNDVYEAGEYRIRVSSEPALPTSGNNPSKTFGYTAGVLTTITKTINSISYTKTLSYTDGVLTSISSWVED